MKTNANYSITLGLGLVLAFVSGCDAITQVDKAVNVAEETTEAGLAQRANNARELGLAMLAYADDSDDVLPPAAGPVEKAGPPVSWRVRLLPFLEEGELYSRYRTVETWDSPHNLALVKEMPEVFGNNSEGKTRFMVFTGDSTLFPSAGALPIGVMARDGYSNTILFVESGPDKTIPWTKPADLPFNPSNPIAALGRLPAGGFHAAFGDGGVEFLSNKIRSAELKALITPNGGEFVLRNR